MTRDEIIFFANLTKILAFTLSYETKLEYSPDGIVDDARNGGDPPAQTPGESTAVTMQALQQHLPELIQTTSNQSIPLNRRFEESRLQTSQALSPAYAQLATDLLAGPGADLVLSAKEIDKLLNPQFYNVRNLQANKFREMLNSVNLDAPDIEAERLINSENFRSGNTTPSSTTALANAINFGEQRMKRQGMLNSMLANATNFLPASQTKFDPFGRQSAIAPTNVGQAGFDAANQMSSNLLGTTAGFTTQANQINSQRRDSLDRVNETMSSLPSYS
jgi:hypothetical protein